MNTLFKGVDLENKIPKFSINNFFFYGYIEIDLSVRRNACRNKTVYTKVLCVGRREGGARAGGWLTYVED